MVYGLRVSTSGPYYTTCVIEPDPLPGLQRLKSDFASQGRFFFSHFLQDMELPQDAFPVRARETQGRKHLHDFLNMSPHLACSESVKDIIEQFEPGFHQFSEVAVTYKDGRPAEKRYFAFRVLRHLDNTLIPEKSFRVACHRRADGGVSYSGTGLDDSYTLDGRAIQGRHLWVAKDVPVFPFWISDEMYRSLRKAKIKGLYYSHQLTSWC